MIYCALPDNIKLNEKTLPISTDPKANDTYGRYSKKLDKYKIILIVLEVGKKIIYVKKGKKKFIDCDFFAAMIITSNLDPIGKLEFSIS